VVWDTFPVIARLAVVVKPEGSAEVAGMPPVVLVLVA